MKKQITTIAIAIFMLAGVMAMYAGESESFETNLTNPVYTVVGNSSNLDGLNITFENGNITISPVLNYKPDNFTLIFFDNITKEVIKTVHTYSGGGTTTLYVDKNVTVYVPEYIDGIVNNTETVEVEKIVDRIVYTEKDNTLIWIGLFTLSLLVIGLIIRLITSKSFKNKEDTTLDEIH